MRYKHRTLLHPLGSLVLLTVLLLSGCDRFSLLEQFQFVGKGGPDSLTLTPSMSTLRPGESCELYPAGGTPPYYFSVSAPDLYSAGNPIDKGSIDADSDPARYVAGNSIGKVTIRLSDGKGKHVDTTVTVLPWEPKNFSVIRTTSPPKVKLHWEYEGVPGYIEGFLLFRAKGGQPFVEYSDVLSADMSRVEDPENNPQNVTYRLYAVAGEYRSAYVEGTP